MTKQKAVWDYDYMKYSIGSISEDRSIIVTHKQSGNQKEFKTRTEFYGHYKTKSGGWLAEVNKQRDSEFTADDFLIEDVQTPKPESFAIAAVKGHIDCVLAKLDNPSHYGYIGKGDSWRVGASTILKYKGNREGSLKPIHLPAIEDYLVKNHSAQFIEVLEADDQVVIDCTKDPSKILIGVDKDYQGCELTLFNPDKMGEPEKITGFGKLWIGSDKKVRGEGRIFKYHQILSGDSSDCYAANSATDMRWGDKNSFSILSKCSNDTEALQGMVDGYKKLYPEPKIITGWRGNSFEIDWLYVLQENFTMAHMLRFENDFVDVKQLLTKLKINI